MFELQKKLFSFLFNYLWIIKKILFYFNFLESFKEDDKSKVLSLLCRLNYFNLFCFYIIQLDLSNFKI